MSNLCIKCLKSKNTDSGAIYGQFLINSLSPGQGITIGTLLRRILLSNLKGTAITRLKFPGITHEFSTIKTLREDLLEIILNLKGIIFKKTNTKSRWIGEEYGKICVQGPGLITAKDIIKTPNLEIINSNHYIATISKPVFIEMEFLFESGTGYMLADHKQTILKGMNTDYFKIDAIFMPILKINFTTENIYTVNNTMYTENLFLDIWTNGSITPQEAIFEASHFIIELFQQIMKKAIKIRVKIPVVENNLILTENFSDIAIEELQLSTRGYNCLKKAQINTVADILNYSSDELNQIQNLGQKCVDEILESLQNKFGIIID